MNTDDRSDECEENSRTADLPVEWARTDRHPRLPDGKLGTCQTKERTVLYDHDRPTRYIVGHTVEVGEPTSIQGQTE